MRMKALYHPPPPNPPEGPYDFWFRDYRFMGFGVSGPKPKTV